MSSEPREYLRHIRDEAAFLTRAAAKTTQAEFMSDEVLRRAVVRSLEIIGEAVKKLPASVTESEPDIKWTRIAGMRDRLIHGYFAVDYEIVWDVVTQNVPALLQAVDRALARS